MLQEKKRLLVIVRTYPIPALKGIEVSCTAGITDDSRWIRLFPVPYRLLKPPQKFGKHQWIEVSVKKASDPRPESYNIYVESLRVISPPLSTNNSWQERKDIVLPLTSHCLCCIKSLRDERQFPTLGCFRPKAIQRLTIQEDSPDWTQEEMNRLNQLDMYRQAPQEELEKVPFKFRYEFICNEEKCSGHALMCTDWEMGESWRKWHREYSNNWEVKFRQRYEYDMIHRLDTHFIVGTHSSHPQEWLIVGLFYPPKPSNLPLFEGLDTRN